MKKKRQLYTLFHKASAVFMILALTWLTISIAFQPGSQRFAKKEKAAQSKSAAAANEEESSGNNNNNNNNNTTEEKVPGSSSLSEEYLHDHHRVQHFFTIISTVHKTENADTYTAFHGELLVPPPNRA